MKYITLIFAFISLYSCGQDIERDLPEKDIYQVVKDEYITTLKTLKLKGNIKSVVEKYKDANINDTIIDFSKYELTNSDIEKEPWVINLGTTYYEAYFNQKGYLIKSFGTKREGNDTMINEYKYNKKDLLMSEKYVKTETSDFLEKTITRKFTHNRKYIYNNQDHLTKITTDKGKFVCEYKYMPKKKQVTYISLAYMTDSLKKTISTYDKYGLELSRQNFNTKNEKDNLWKYEYDKTGQQIKEIFKGSDGRKWELNLGKIDTTVKIYRLYDKNKNCIERIARYKNGRLAIRTLKIEYY